MDGRRKAQWDGQLVALCGVAVRGRQLEGCTQLSIGRLHAVVN